MREPSFPERSARTFAVWAPVISQSGAVLPLPLASTAWLLLMAMIFHRVGPQASVTHASIRTGTILWFGGQMHLGVAVTLVISGAIVSNTVTVVEHETVLPVESVATTET